MHGLGVEAESGPAMASYMGDLYVAWVDDNNHFIHIMRLDANGQADIQYETAYTAEGSPALGVVNGQFMLALTQKE